MPDHAFLTTLAFVGGVILVAGLLSGVVEKSRFPQVAVLLALGACAGPAGLGLITLPLDAPLLRVVATVALLLVLFTDAVGLDIRETRRHAGLAALVLGPGTLLSAALVALAAHALLGLPATSCAILGAALASTDPVLLRGILKHPAIPGSVQQALRLESGLNDAVLVPIVLVAMAFAFADPTAPATDHPVGPVMMRSLLIGPAAGVGVALAAIGALELMRRRAGVRRDHESIYSLGVAFVAFAAGEALHGSGLLAAFAAGLTVAMLDVELCDCFLEYGQTTAEMALLFTFVLLGAGPIWTASEVLDWRTILFAVVVLAARPAAFIPALLPARGLDARSRGLIAWFGPRGLSSLLLALVPVFAGMPGAERLFAIACLVVLLSVVVHGGSVYLLPKGSAEVVNIELPKPSADTVTIDELQRLEADGSSRVVLLDVRTDRSMRDSGRRTLGTQRFDPSKDSASQAKALGLPQDAWLIAFCA